MNEKIYLIVIYEQKTYLLLIYGQIHLSIWIEDKIYNC